jgi:hypothetical protein
MITLFYNGNLLDVFILLLSINVFPKTRKLDIRNVGNKPKTKMFLTNLLKKKKIIINTISVRNYTYAFNT